jgi:RNA polymerase sigma-70 factor (ECF subfamily)
VITSDPDQAQRSAALVRTARAAGRGDRAALTELVSATSSTVWRTCAGLVDRASADDLTQETYLCAVRSLATYRGESDPTRWLLTIARRVCADEIGRRQKARTTIARLRAERMVQSIDPGGLSHLADALDRLRTERRDALVLTAVAGLSYAEAAQVCDCPVGTIRSRVARARADLLDLLDPGRDRTAEVAG